MSDDETTSNETGPRSFLHFLSALGDGLTARDLSENLHDIVRKLHDIALETGANAKGELTIKLAFKTDKAGVCTVTPDVKMKLPMKPTTSGIMWHDPKTGHLVSQNPRQLTLGKLREVPRKRPRFEEDDDEGTGSAH